MVNVTIYSIHGSYGIWNPYSCSLRLNCSNIFRQFEAYSTYSFYNLSFSLGQTLISRHFCSFQLVKCERPGTKNTKALPGTRRKAAAEGFPSPGPLKNGLVELRRSRGNMRKPWFLPTIMDFGTSTRFFLTFFYHHDMVNIRQSCQKIIRS